jgi:hypothetical protein
VEAKYDGANRVTALSYGMPDLGSDPGAYRVSLVYDQLNLPGLGTVTFDRSR